MAIRIPIISSFDSKGIEKATKQFEQLKTTGERAQFGLEKAAKPAALGLLALGAAATVATAAAVQDAAAQDQLAGVLVRQAGATKEQVAQTEEFISALSRATATADDDLRPALSSLVNATGDLQKAQNLLRISQDLAAATNVDLATASDAVSKAYNGQMKGLATLDPSLRGVIASGATFEEVMARVAQTTGGAAARAANTTAGQFKTLQIQFGELQETIGAKLLPVAEKLVGFLIRTVDFMAANTGVVIFFGTAFGLLAAAIVGANIALKAKAAALVLYKVAAAIATAVNFALATSITAVQVATGVGIAVVLAAAAALATYVAGQKKLQKELDASIDKAKQFDSAIDGATVSTFRFNNALAILKGEHNNEARARLASVGALDAYNEKVKASRNATGGATQAVVDFARQVKDGLQQALDSAKTNLQAAKDAFTAFGDTVALGVKAGLSFADAYKLIDDNGKTFMENLREQVEGIKKYAANLQILLTRGLSQDALKYVLEAGGEAGAAIAAELVAGTTDLITGPGGINEMVAAANAAADAVGLQGATKWYQAGIDQAQAIVDGIDAQLALLTPKLMARMDKIAAKLGRTVDIAVRVTETVTRMIGGGSAIPRLAEGGIVTRPTLAMIGEAGPEAVIPLNRLGNGGGITVNVMGGLSTSAEIGQAVVNAIRAYNRSAGPANIQVA
jgi:hypothetical protein